MSPVVKALMYALTEGVIVMSDLTRTYKKKVVNECELIDIDGKKLYNLVVDLIESLRQLYVFRF